MSGDQGSSEEKKLPPTKKKILDARRKGRIATSRDFIGAAGTVAGLGYVIIRGPALVDAAGSMIADASAISTQPFNVVLPQLMSRAYWNFADFFLPLIGMILVCVICAAMITNQGFVFSGDPLTPDLTRISPGKGWSRIASQRNLINALGLIFKFSVIAVAVALIIRLSLNALVQLPGCGAACAPGFIRRTFSFLLIAVALLFLALGGLDIVLQRFLFWKEMHMTRTELKRERKETEGEISSKQARKQKIQASMQNQVRISLESAAFVIHGEDIAVAMAYSVATPIPTLVARAGADSAALLLEQADELDLPCVQNQVVAAQVAAKMQMGEALPKVLFVPVIECMRIAGVL